MFLDKGALARHRRSVRVQALEKKVASVLRLSKQGLSRLRSFLRNPIRGLASLLRSARRWIWSSEETRFYRAEANAAGSADSEIRRDSLRDLLCYEPAGRDSRSKQEFLSDSLAAIESGVHCYSLVRNNMIVSCAWVTTVATKAPINESTAQPRISPTISSDL